MPAQYPLEPPDPTTEEERENRSERPLCLVCQSLYSDSTECYRGFVQHIPVNPLRGAPGLRFFFPRPLLLFSNRYPVDEFQTLSTSSRDDSQDLGHQTDEGLAVVASLGYTTRFPPYINTFRRMGQNRQGTTATQCSEAKPYLLTNAFERRTDSENFLVTTISFT